MSRSANVRSVQTLKDFKVALINFAEDARNALSGVEMELRRIRNWLERDQLGYWQTQVKRRNEEVDAGADRAAPPQDLAAGQRRRLRHRAEGSAARGAAAAADAEEKVALVKKLIPQLHHAIAEYHSHSQPLGDHLTGGVRSTRCALLERMVIVARSVRRHHGPVGAAVRSGRRVLGGGRHGRRGRPRPRAGRPAGDARPAGRRPAATADGRPRPRPADGDGTGAGPGRRGRHRRGGPDHERRIRPAPARPEDTSASSGTSPRRPGTTRSPATSRRTTSSRSNRGQERDHRHGQDLRGPRQAPPRVLRKTELGR